MIDKKLRDHMRFIVERLGDAALENNPTLVMFHAGQLAALMGQSGILEEPATSDPQRGSLGASTDFSSGIASAASADIFLGDSQ